MEIIILVCYTQLNTLTTDAFQVLGRIAIFFLFAISFISFIRFIYTLAKLYQ